MRGGKELNLNVAQIGPFRTFEWGFHTENNVDTSIDTSNQAYLAHCFLKMAKQAAHKTVKNYNNAHSILPQYSLCEFLFYTAGYT